MTQQDTIRFVGAVACQNFFYSAAESGDSGPTQECYNAHLALANGTVAGAAATHCPHAMGASGPCVDEEAEAEPSCPSYQGASGNVYSLQ